MLNSKTDAKNVQLLKLLAQLRDHIDMHRIIGLNVGALQEGQISGAVLGYLQKSAHEALAIYICKIFAVFTRICSGPCIHAVRRRRRVAVAFWTLSRRYS